MGQYPYTHENNKIMSGKQVYIDEAHHKKLKLASTIEDKPMGTLVEEYIENMTLDLSQLPNNGEHDEQDLSKALGKA